MNKRSAFLRRLDAQAASFGRLSKPDLLLPKGAVTITHTASQLGELMDLHSLVFAWGGKAFHLRQNKEDLPQLEPISNASLSSLMEEVAKVCTLVKQKDQFVPIPTVCPEKTSKLISSSSAFLHSLPQIKTITACPVLVPGAVKGSLREIVDYDYSSCVFAAGKKTPPVDLPKARELLLQSISGFRFASTGDSARALAMLLTPALVMGSLLTGRAPIDLSEADESQAGKGYRNKIKAALYRDRVQVVAQRKGGVGSLMESFNAVLISGRPFICLDNMRGRVNEPSFEAFMTEDAYSARAAYKPTITIDPRRFSIMMTSNQADLTEDLANRCCCVRILKQPSGHQFMRYSEGDLLDHIRSNQPLFLGAVFAVIREWHQQGCQRTDETRHDFRDWCQVLDWICQNLLGTVPIMEGHRDIQTRTSTPHLNWLRDVSLAVMRTGNMDCWLSATAIIGIIEDEDIEVPGISEGDSLGSSKVQASVRQQIGRRMAKIFKKGECVQVDTLRVERQVKLETREGGGSYDKKTYRFSDFGPRER